jgi:hypothetical protein
MRSKLVKGTRLKSGTGFVASETEMVAQTSIRVSVLLYCKVQMCRRLSDTCPIQKV